MSKIDFYYNDCGKYKGRPKVYWHYLYGYFLPLIFFLQKNPSIKNSRIGLLDCGVGINGKISEILDIMEFEYTFLPNLIKKRFEFTHNKNTIILERWDLNMFNNNFKVDKLLQTKQIILELFDINPYETTPLYTIIQRTEAVLGVLLTNSSRKLLNIERSIEVFEESNIKVQLKELGLLKLKNQIEIFSQSEGIIGIRGSDFANMLWLKQHTINFMYDTTEFTDKRNFPFSILPVYFHESLKKKMVWFSKRSIFIVSKFCRIRVIPAQLRLAKLLGLDLQCVESTGFDAILNPIMMIERIGTNLNDYQHH